MDIRRRPRRARQISATDRLVLDIESRWGSSYATQDAKLAHARAEGIEPHEYALILRGLIDDPLAAEYAPDVISALRGRRSS